jgi:hypothetical protein
MSLEHVDQDGIIDHRTMSHVAFPMKDIDTLKVIPCRIGDETLQDVFGPATDPVLEIFENNRSNIEAAASEKYDSAGKPERIELVDSDFA